jgi:serine/threonine protein kinase
MDQGLDELKVHMLMKSQSSYDRAPISKFIEPLYYSAHLILVFELLGPNLYQVLQTKGPFPVGLVKQIARQVLQALVFIHDLGLIHADLKPENIVTYGDSRTFNIKLLDFGSSCFSTDDLSVYVQSQAYRAPEVLLGASYDARIDIWSLGCVLFELYTGRLLFPNDSVEEALYRISRKIGPLPKLGRYYDVYYDGDRLKREADFSGLKVPPLYRAFGYDGEFLEYMLLLLELDPSSRLSAREALAHDWLAD